MGTIRVQETFHRSLPLIRRREEFHEAIDKAIGEIQELGET